MLKQKRQFKFLNKNQKQSFREISKETNPEKSCPESLNQSLSKNPNSPTKLELIDQIEQWPQDLLPLVKQVLVNRKEDIDKDEKCGTDQLRDRQEEYKKSKKYQNESKKSEQKSITEPKVDIVNFYQPTKRKHIEPQQINDQSEQIEEIEEIEEAPRNIAQKQTKIKENFYSSNEKTKSYLISNSFQAVLENFVKIQENQYQCHDNKMDDKQFQMLLEDWTTNFNGLSFENFKKRALFNAIDSKERVKNAWFALKTKINQHLAFFDSNLFCENLPEDVIGQNQKSITFKFQKENIVEQLLKVINQLVQKIPEIIQSGSEYLRCMKQVKIFLNFTIQADLIDKINLQQIDSQSLATKKASIFTHSIDFIKIIQGMISYQSQLKESQKEDLEEEKRTYDIRKATGSLLSMIGLDFSSLICQKMSNFVIKNVQITFYEVPQIFCKNKATDEVQRHAIKLSNNQKVNIQEADVVYQAIKPLYAISRARVQYVGSVVPLFKYKHCLFEALISSIHEKELTPSLHQDLEKTEKDQGPSVAHQHSTKAELVNREQGLSTDLGQNQQGKSKGFEQKLPDHVIQERFLVKKFLEFCCNPNLEPLIQMSNSGDCLSFVRYFNQLSESRSPFYSRYKLCFYDINQRKFIVEAQANLVDENSLEKQTTYSNKEVYMVHFNGYVFGTNLAKLIIIREREALKEIEDQESEGGGEDEFEAQIRNESEQDVSLNSESEDESSQNCDSADGQKNGEDKNFDNNKLSTLAELFGNKNSKNCQEKEQNNDRFKTDEEMQHENLEIVKDEPNDSQDEILNVQNDYESSMSSKKSKKGLEIKKSFILTGRLDSFASYRRKKWLQDQLKKENLGEKIHDMVGVMAIKIEFKNDSQIPLRLVCYGQLPQTGEYIFKEFTGEKCHLKFLLWAIQNATPYAVDTRLDQTELNIYTFGGSQREMPLLFRGLTTLCGRDAFYIGDLQRLLAIWHENIKIFDMANYFDEKKWTFESLCLSWKIKGDTYELPKLINLLGKNIIPITKQHDQTVKSMIKIFQIARHFIFELGKISFSNGSKGKFDFQSFNKATSGGVSLAIFQFIYLQKEKVEIKGTTDLQILEKERQSIRPSAYCVDNLDLHFTNKFPHDVQKVSENKNFFSYRLFSMNDLQKEILIKTPVPYMLNKVEPVKFNFDKSQDCDLNIDLRQFHLYFSSLKEFHCPQEKASPVLLQIKDSKTLQVLCQVKIRYASLYKIDELEYDPQSREAFIWKMYEQSGDKKTFSNQKEPQKLTDVYIWGVELIFALKNPKHLSKLVISEEIQYLQGRIYGEFAHEIFTESQKTKSQIRKDILEMILENATSKYTEKVFNFQRLLHKNDIDMATGNADRKGMIVDQTAEVENGQLEQLLDLGQNTYYAEFATQKVQQLEQITSLCRMKGFLNAVSRTKLLQSLTSLSLDPNHLAYLDQNYLCVRDYLPSEKYWFNSMSQNLKPAQKVKNLGKWKLLIETSSTSILPSDQLGEYELIQYDRLKLWSNQIRTKVQHLIQNSQKLLPNNDKDRINGNNDHFMQIYQQFVNYNEIKNKKSSSQYEDKVKKESTELKNDRKLDQQAIDFTNYLINIKHKFSQNGKNLASENCASDPIIVDDLQML